ncbi:hypothetical protein M885DRAFT_521119 [Pelagophyceae sp. CCMP2097]|nr:hypothetical protein M885DRAFT_521119 [Pelagophyceae sp. CCMP2097]
MSRNHLLAAATHAARRGVYADAVKYSRLAIPDTEYHAHRVCGAAFLALGAFEQATPHIEAAQAALSASLAVADDYSDLVGVLNDLALCRHGVGRADDAAACLRRALYMARRGYRPDAALQRVTLFHLALTSGDAECLDDALALLPQNWLDKQTTDAGDALHCYVLSSSLALRRGNVADAAYSAQLAVEAARRTRFDGRSITATRHAIALATAQNAAVAVARRAVDLSCDDAELDAAGSKLWSAASALAAPDDGLRAEVHFTLTLPYADAKRSLSKLLASTAAAVRDAPPAAHGALPLLLKLLAVSPPVDSATRLVDAAREQGGAGDVVALLGFIGPLPGMRALVFPS